ncbi:MAG TPA: sn-glycerol-3-phosphate ABC transporter ATP-binding protein UgpC [Gemmatimonadales bacterium]|jgi:ABC-type sugar transport system ATPase subunit|nr:sn-glycerol-3-phosphate ABC transporter ATP-binding protein UgpC [Gemmatimonadales bacterium]
MATVTLEGVRKIYEEKDRTHVAVHRLDLAVADGEFVVLVGPSGCGKSTTLRMIAGLESITEGVLRIGDRVVNDVPPRDRDIAMVFQNYALYPHMTVYENLAFALRLRKLAAPEIDRRVRQAADLLNLGAMLERRPRQLSGGERQRVAVGRAIVRQPEVFLFDEPLSNLDARLRVQMRRELAGLHRRLGVTTIYVTHDQVEAMTLGDRVVVMKDGMVQQVGTPLEIYRTPANTFVATFIGSPAMTLIPGRLDAEGRFTAETGALSFSRGLPLPPALPRGRPVLLGVRPEAIRLAPPGTPEAEATVMEVELLGSETVVALEAGGVTLTARADSAAPARRGDRVGIALAGEGLHWFDAETGTRYAAG